MDNSPSTCYHSEPVKEINASLRANMADGIAETDLTEEGLLTAAREATGLDRFGDESFLPALRILLKSLNTEADLSPYGRLYASSSILGSLKNRLWANACFEAHPEILQRKIVAPLIIVGPHRSGTTRIQRMIACDRRFQHLSTWEGINPAPRTASMDSGKGSERYQEVKDAFLGMQPLYTSAFDAHPMDADWPEEEMLLLNHSFCSFSWMGNFAIPEFYQWFRQADMSDGYRYMANLMRLISWNRGDPEDKPWLLKDPEHMLHLDVLMKVFPDAKIIFTHRHPRQTVASIISLMWLFARQHTEGPCRARMRDVWLDFCEEAAERCCEQRKNIPQLQQMDVLYDDMNQDWKAVIQRIYSFAGLPLTDEAEQALGGWLAESEKENRHAKHKYALEDFGTTEQIVDSRMGTALKQLRLLEKSKLPNGPDMNEKELLPIFRDNPFEFFRKCYSEYGDMFTLQLGDFGIKRHGASGKWVFLANADYLRVLFKTNSSIALAGAANSILFQEIIPPEGSLMLDGAKHIERRKILGRLLQNEKKIRGFTHDILDIVSAEVAKFPANDVFELTPVFRRISAEIMKNATFGSIDRDETTAITTNISTFGDPKLSFDQKDELVNKCTASIKELMDACPHAPPENDNSIYSVLMDSWKSESILSEADVSAELLVIMLGGVDTTGSTMAWVMAQIFKHAEVYEKVMSEINLVFGEDALTAEKVDQLNYLQAVIYEACRISPALRNGATRLLIQPLEIGGYTLPAGTVVASCMHLIHSRADYYPEPAVFKPERFLNQAPDPYQFAFFGGGIRRCLGMAFALYEIKTVIAAILHAHHFEPINPSVEPELQGSFFGPKGSIGVKLR